MNAVILTPALFEGDAVGNDVLGMAAVLRSRGVTVNVAVRFASPYPTMPLEAVPDLLRDPEDVLIYHHSIGCEEAVRLVEALPCRKIVKYHNVTPPQFFHEHTPEVAGACADGQRQTSRLLRPDVTVWVDSPFNGRALEALCPGQAYAILPPFNQVDRLLVAAPDVPSVSPYPDWTITILVVGRVVPNKNVMRALEAFASYQARHDRHARLVLAGGQPQSPYLRAVQERACQLRLERTVFVTGKVSLGQLKALYLSAQVLLTTSRHEGFCLPLVEAMGLRVPIVAVPVTAVPETGGDVPLYAADDPDAIADVLAAVRDDPIALEDRLHRGWQRYEQCFDNRIVAERFLRLFDAASGVTVGHHLEAVSAAP
jgi:glycosyltransferase involved in cell wall biosynthesis